jgi:hypothetical protein
VISGRADSDPTDGFTFINQRPNSPTTGFSGTVFLLSGGASQLMAALGNVPATALGHR